MSISFFRKLFGSDESVKQATEQAEAEAEAKATECNEPDCEDNAELVEDDDTESSDDKGGFNTPIANLEQFVMFVVKNLVDSPDLVTYETVEKNRINIIQIRCAKKDIGKIIGKSGKTISALRLLVQNAAGRNGRRVSVDVLD